VSVDVVDSKGCNAAIGTSITENLAVTSTTTAQNASIGNSDGSGSVTAVGGVAPYTYVWSSGQTSSAATGLSAGIYIIGIEDNAGCTVTDMVIIEVAMIDAATAFTPNGDGVNDFWTIGDMSLYPNVEVTIMGRWGQMIFNSIGYEDPWDGTYQGKELPMGSYFFIIDLHEGSDPVTGAVTIMK
jgi:gliding motility-associated-like protein